MNEPRTLRSLVLAAQQQRGGASGRELARAAQKRGFKVTFTTLNAIAAGTYKSKPSPDTIRAIGWLAGVPEKVAFAAAGVPMPGPPFADELPPGVDNLTPRSRRAAIEVLRALVEAEQKAGGERADRSAPKTPAGDEPASKVHDLNQPDQGDPPPPPLDRLAARNLGTPSRGQQIREQQDDASERPDGGRGE